MAQVEKVLGTITEDEKATLNNRRNLTSQVLTQIGNLEWQKSRLTSQLEMNEQAARQLLAEIRDRFEIGEDDSWKVDQDGSFIVLVEEESTEEPASES